VHGFLGLPAVQYSTHTRGPSRNDWWQIVLLLAGLVLLVRGAWPMIRVLRWRTHALPGEVHAHQPGAAISWSLILGLVIVGSFFALTAT
jgi:hypothetical protein